MANSFVTRMIMDRRRRERERDERMDGRNRDYEHEDMRYRDGRGYDRNYDRGYDRGRGEYEGEFRGNYENDYEMDGRRYYRRDRDYEETDGRRGVKGTGRYGIGGRDYYLRRDRDYEDRGDYGRDYGEEVRLTSREMDEWKRMLRNADGTQGEHFTMSQVQQAAQSAGLRMDNYDEKELCMTMNMLYSDYCDVFKALIPREKEPHIYAKFAKAFLEDPDASVKGREKLAAYFMAIVDPE